MALFQPTNVIPSALSGEGNGTIDVTQPLTVSWQVNGNSPMVAYRIKIMQNDAESTLRLDTGKITLSTPFFGADAWGNPRSYNAAITADQMLSAGMMNGYANGYKMTIQQWWTANDSIEQASASYFITRNKPTVTLQVIPYRNDFRQQEHTFEAFYAQAQEDALDWYRWELQAKVGNEYITIDDTGCIYSGGLIPYYGYYGIQYTYNGFLIGTTGTWPGVQYRIRCTVQTENGVQADNGWDEFTTQNINSNTASLRLCSMKDTDAIKIMMPKNFPILGAANGRYSYETIVSGMFMALNLSGGATVSWGDFGLDSLQINTPPYTIQVKMDMTNVSSPSTFFSASYGAETLAFSYDASGFSIQFGSEGIWRSELRPALNAQITIALTNENIYLGTNSNGTIQYESAGIRAWQKGEMESISIHGAGRFRYVWIENGNMPEHIVMSYIYTANSYPVQANTTQFLATLQDTLYTGGSLLASPLTAGEETESFSIYKKAASSPLFHFIANVPFDEYTKDMVIYDYAVKNQEPYEYFFLGMLPNSYARFRNGIGAITPCFWNYTVLCCTQNNSGDYIVKSEYRFAMDVASGNVGNNNSPTLQQNFTPYPLRQPSASNYRSGTLSAFIGKVQNDQYIDTANLMDELYGLSTNGMTKFLKTRKGQIFQIETSAPVSMQIGDKYTQQPAKISLPWVEVGDASTANILGEGSTITDAPRFRIDPETMELTMSYRAKSPMGADSFQMIDQDIYLLNPGTYNESDFSMNDKKEIILQTQ